jgi:hypothetical protein
MNGGIVTTQDKIHYYLSLCTHRQCVEFALYCAKDAANTSKLRDENINKCIDLIEKWLINPNTVTEKELVNTAIAASHAAHYATYHAAHAAANAANAAANAAHAAAHAVDNAAAHAVDNVAYASYADAHAAANAAHSICIKDKRKEQLTYLLNNVLKLNEFDKLMANMEEV